MAGGIYIIRNKLTGQFYIGKTKDFEERWQGHRQSLARGGHDSKRLLEAWRKYGEPAFEFLCLLKIADSKERTKTERIYLDVLWDVEGTVLYNTSPNPGGPAFHTEETKRALSIRRRGQRHTEEARRRIGEASKRQVFTEAKKLALMQGLKAWLAAGNRAVLSPEGRRKISEANSYSRTEETKKRMAEAQKKKYATWTEERRAIHKQKAREAKLEKMRPVAQLDRDTKCVLAVYRSL